MSTHGITIGIFPGGVFSQVAKHEEGGIFLLLGGAHRWSSSSESEESRVFVILNGRAERADSDVSDDDPERGFERAV